MTSEKPTIGVSACLLGHALRYDGKHQYNAYLVKKLSLFFQLMPVCPEVEIGLGVPRAKIQIRNQHNSNRLVGVEDPSMDVTNEMIQFAKQFISNSTISGLVIKDNSPSCGLGNTKIFDDSGKLSGFGNGLFTETVLEYRPELPIISAGRLNHGSELRQFIARVLSLAG